MSVIGILRNYRWLSGPYGPGKSKNKNREPKKIKATARQKKYVLKRLGLARGTFYQHRPYCNADCTFTFTREAVIVRDTRGTPVLTGWREDSGPRICRIALQPGEANLPQMLHTANMATLEVYSAYDLPIVSALIRYFHAAEGYPVRSTWLTAISDGNYSSWPGLTLVNATKYCPSATATIMVYIVQKRQGVRSTKHKLPATSSPDQQPPPRSAQMSCT